MERLDIIKNRLYNERQGFKNEEQLQLDDVDWLVSEVELLRENQGKIKPFIQLFNENFGTNLAIGKDEFDTTFERYRIVKIK